MQRIRMVWVWTMILTAWANAQPGQYKNGFDVSNALIDVNEIFHGGPPKDGIPAIDHPKFIAVSKVDYLKEDDIVIGVVRGDKQRAYPLRILVWHEIVNDTFDKKALAITYCPLCGTAMVFEREINDEVKTFGVSGLLYQSDVLMYDRQSQSLWSQLAMKAISGKDVNTPLKWIASEHLTWRAWREKYPDSLILSTDTGFRRHYQQQAYAAYFASDKTMFPVKKTRQELSNKEKVLGVIVEGQAKAYPLNKLPDNQPVHDTIGTKQVVIHYDRKTHFPRFTSAAGEDIPAVVVFWFAWQAFYPQTKLWDKRTH